MTAKSEPKLRLPEGLSPEQEAQWWDEHREYWDSIDTEWEVMPPMQIRRTAPVKLRLPVDLLEKLKAEAAHQGVSHQWLIKTWLEERLRAVGEPAAGPAPSDESTGTRQTA